MASLLTSGSILDPSSATTRGAIPVSSTTEMSQILLKFKKIHTNFDYRTFIGNDDQLLELYHCLHNLFAMDKILIFTKKDLKILENAITTLIHETLSSSGLLINKYSENHVNTANNNNFLDLIKQNHCKIQDLIEEISKLTTINESLKKELTENRKDQAKLHSKLVRSRNEIDNRYANAEKEKFELNNKLIQIQDENRQLSMRLQNKTMLLEQLKNEVLGLTEENATLRIRCEELTKKMQKLSEKNDRISMMIVGNQNSTRLIDIETQINYSQITENKVTEKESITHIFEQMAIQADVLSIVSKKNTKLMELFYRMNDVMKALESQLSITMSKLKFSKQRCESCEQKCADLISEAETAKFELLLSSDKSPNDDLLMKNQRLNDLLRNHMLAVFHLMGNNGSLEEAVEQERKKLEEASGMSLELSDDIFESAIAVERASSLWNRVRASEDEKCLLKEKLEQIAIAANCDFNQLPGELIDKLSDYDFVSSKIMNVLHIPESKRPLHEVLAAVIRLMKLFEVFDRAVRREIEFSGDINNMPQFIIEKFRELKDHPAEVVVQEKIVTVPEIIIKEKITENDPITVPDEQISIRIEQLLKENDELKERLKAIEKASDDRIKELISQMESAVKEANSITQITVKQLEVKHQFKLHDMEQKLETQSKELKIVKKQANAIIKAYDKAFTQQKEECKALKDRNNELSLKVSQLMQKQSDSSSEELELVIKTLRAENESLQGGGFWRKEYETLKNSHDSFVNEIKEVLDIKEKKNDDKLIISRIISLRSQ